MNRLLKLLPWLLLALFVTEIVVILLPKKDGEFHVAAFGRLPVLMNGRIQPLDSVARNSLLQIRSTGDVPLELLPSWQFWRHPQKLRSSEWLAEAFFHPERADTRPIFLIHHPELISELKLGETGIEKSGLRYYTYQELRPVVDEIFKQGRQASQIEAAHHTTYQKQVLKLANAVVLYQELKNTIQPESTHDFAGWVTAYEKSLPAGMATQVQLLQTMAQYTRALAIPPLHAADKDAWANVGSSLLDSRQTGKVHPAVALFARMATAYHDRNAPEFNRAVAEYKAWLTPNFAGAVAKGESEFYFNRIKTFLHATIIYIAAFVLAAGALLTFGLWPSLSESLRRSAAYLIGLAFVVHTFGLVYRMVLEGRPPVTNLYSSAIFIGWGACLLGLVLERTYKVGLGSAVAGLAGFVTLLIAHNLALGGDTMEMMRAVLDTNFWLATHVVTITLGYSATFVAGGLALGYIVLGVATPLLASKVGTAGDVTLGKALTKMVYAIVCFATFFSFIGTVLGGIWADQSWGRFWGWDPKENGALLIVLWNAIILHARWGGLVKERGLMNLAIFGNIVTAFSWFGVNMLGIGLHSYGFMDAAFKWLMLFNATQVAIIVLGCLPQSCWRSSRVPAGK
jgi:cytochrome c-type biogenesis protein CcsB